MTQDQFLARVFAESNKQLGRAGLTRRQVEVVTRSVFDQMAEALREEGNFWPASASGPSRSRNVRRVRDGTRRPAQAIDIPASKTIGFKAGAGLKKAVTP